MNNISNLRSLESIASDVISHRYCQSDLADALEVLILQASRRFNEVMIDIGNDNVSENKKQLCDLILSNRHDLEEKA